MVSLQHHSASYATSKTAQKSCSLIEVGFGDGDQVRVHSSHDGDEGRLSSECREHTTELTWTRHIEQVLGLGEGGKEEGRGTRERKQRSITDKLPPPDTAIRKPF